MHLAPSLLPKGFMFRVEGLGVKPRPGASSLSGSATLISQTGLPSQTLQYVVWSRDHFGAKAPPLLPLKVPEKLEYPKLKARSMSSCRCPDAFGISDK